MAPHRELIISHLNLLLVAAAMRQRRKQASKRAPRRFWVHPINQHRRTKGSFFTQYRNLRQHEEKFYDHFRMGPIASFDLLLSILEVKLLKPSIRPSISPEERLLITIHYLATGMWTFY